MSQSSNHPQVSQSVAAFPGLVTLKSLLENPVIPSRYYRKLGIGVSGGAGAGVGSVFSMNNKKVALNSGELSSLAGLSHSPNGNLSNSPAAVAASWSVGMEQFESTAAQAFLGPSIWDKASPYESLGGPGGVGAGHDFKLEYMDLDEFLSENGLGGASGQSSSGHGHHSGGMGVGVASPSPCSSPHHGGHLGASGEDNKVSSTTGSKERDGSPGDLAGVAHLLTKDALHIGPDVNGEFAISPADIALATVPGSTVNFDPRRRRFSEEELKPQPMVKKSKKQFVPDDLKDEKYWARRRKNNLAAKRSRDARRIKENQIAIRAAYLEKENAKLREQLDKMTRENMLLRDKIAAVAKGDLK